MSNTCPKFYFYRLKYSKQYFSSKYEIKNVYLWCHSKNKNLKRDNDKNSKNIYYFQKFCFQITKN